MQLMFSTEAIKAVQNSMFNTNLASALIGGSVTALAVMATILWEARKNKNSADDELKAVCSALKTELESVLGQYDEVRQKVEALKENEPYWQNYRIDMDYFAVYHGNSVSLGKLPDPARTDIVIAYTKMKSLIDTFKENNHTLEGYNKFVLENTRLTLLNTDNDPLRKHIVEVIRHYEENMCLMGQSLKVVSADAVRTARKAITSLNSYPQRK